MIKRKTRRAARVCGLLAAIMLLNLLAACGQTQVGIYPQVQAQGEYTALTAAQKAAIPLINAAHPLPDDFSLPQIEGRAEGEYQVAGGFSPLVNLYDQRHSFRLSGSEIWLCRHVYEAMERMFSQAEAENVNGFIITSGYRTRARQQEIYKETQKGLAAQPGQSEHETGLSFDVTANRDSGDFSATPQYKWLINNCWKYGFILRYPDGTANITGITGESWHFRYVGTDAALEILAKGVTLEEYLTGITLDPISSKGVWAAASAPPAAASAAPTANAASAAIATIQPASAPKLGTTPAAAAAPQANASASARTPAAQTSATKSPAAQSAVISQSLAAPQASAAAPSPTPLPTVSATQATFAAQTFTLEGKTMEFIDPTYQKQDGVDVIYLAGGCFWGMEKLMQSLDGVLSATNGFANGTVPAPSYERVCAGDTGHRETVRVEYDPKIISLDELLYAYFQVIDPELIDRQGHDIGSQYQAGIYYVTQAACDAVAKAAEAEKAEYAHFAVEIAPLTCFYEAEEYHQDYLDKNPGGYCHIPLADINRIAKELNGK